MYIDNVYICIHMDTLVTVRPLMSCPEWRWRGGGGVDSERLGFSPGKGDAVAPTLWLNGIVSPETAGLAGVWRLQVQVQVGFWGLRLVGWLVIYFRSKNAVVRLA
jgi:hypothetical protein